MGGVHHPEEFSGDFGLEQKQCIRSSISRLCRSQLPFFQFGGSLYLVCKWVLLYIGGSRNAGLPVGFPFKTAANKCIVKTIHTHQRVDFQSPFSKVAFKGKEHRAAELKKLDSLGALGQLRPKICCQRARKLSASDCSSLLEKSSASLARSRHKLPLNRGWCEGHLCFLASPRSITMSCLFLVSTQLPKADLLTVCCPRVGFPCYLLLGKHMALVDYQTTGPSMFYQSNQKGRLC